MPQNILLRSGDDALLVGANNTSKFVDWLTSHLAEGEFVTSFTVAGVMNHFDKLDHEGVVFRGELVEWLLTHKGQRVACTIE